MKRFIIFLKKQWVIIVLLLLLGAAVTKIVWKHMMIPGTDYYYHGIEAINIFQGRSIKQTYPLWHFGVKFLERIWRVPLFHAASVVTVIIFALQLIVTYAFFCKYAADAYSRKLYAVIAGTVLLVQPISIEGLTGRVTWGLALINNWHSPTNPLAVAFGLVAIYCLFEIIEKWDKEAIIAKKWVAAFSIMNVVACLGKPAFAQVFMPAITIYCIVWCICKKFKNIKLCGTLALALVPNLIILLVQFYIIFGDSLKKLFSQREGIAVASTTLNNIILSVSKPGMEFSFLDGFIRQYENWPFVLLGIFLFPVYVAVMGGREYWRDKKNQIVWLISLVAFLEKACLVETGTWSGNDDFSWGFCVALNMLYLMNILYLSKKTAIKLKPVRIAGLGIYLLNVWCGCTYLYWQLFVPGFWY